MTISAKRRFISLTSTNFQPHSYMATYTHSDSTSCAGRNECVTAQQVGSSDFEARAKTVMVLAAFKADARVVQCRHGKRCTTELLTSGGMLETYQMQSPHVQQKLVGYQGSSRFDDLEYYSLVDGRSM